jgi:rare lipoprotein A
VKRQVRNILVASGCVLGVVLFATAATPPDTPKIVQLGKASYYGDRFHGRKTASGERFNQHAMTAASKELPLGTQVKVTNLETGKTIDVEVNDRGPYVKGRIIDLSKGAAAALDMHEDGVVPVKVEARPKDQPTPELQDKVAALAEAQKKGIDLRTARRQLAAEEKAEKDGAPDSVPTNPAQAKPTSPQPSKPVAPAATKSDGKPTAAKTASRAAP